jgi:hypothetical protein
MDHGRHLALPCQLSLKPQLAKMSLDVRLLWQYMVFFMHSGTRGQPPALTDKMAQA